jgi:small subunit ribosomal protein S21
VEVLLHENDRLDVVLKKFRRQVTKAGLFRDLKKGRFYESSSARRRRKDKVAARRKAKAGRRSEQY